MRLILALLSLSAASNAFASDCTKIASSNSEVCKGFDDASLDITYRGKLVTADHAVFAKGTINGVAFSQRLEAYEPMEGESVPVFAHVAAEKAGSMEVELSFVDDTGKTDGSYQLRFE